MDYNFSEIEKKWQNYWKKNKTFHVDIDQTRPKLYVLDMFPYPSGAGLHVGHPLGYIASDIYSRYKRLTGFNVLHPMGYDAFGLPAEQYAIQTGQHPAITTENNIKRYREQLDKIGFSFDWNRGICTCDPDYYKWTQWAFIEMFNSYYCYDKQQARPITELIAVFEQRGTEKLNSACSEQMTFTAAEWKLKTEDEKQQILFNYRLAYLGETVVNWCAALGTVLANDEVKDGLSERGGHPVEQRKMRQWMLRVSAYSERLLTGLDKINWSESLKEMQRNWIGKSEGVEVLFKANNDAKQYDMTVFTTRADTIFGVTFMVLAPESEWVDILTASGQRAAVDEYLKYVKGRTELERKSETKKVTGVFTGSHAINPFTKEKVEIWISDYVLAGYGTGAIMAVPAHDSRDYAFAKHFKLPIKPLVEGCDVSEESFDAKEGIMCNSGFLDGMQVKDAIGKAIEEVEKRKIGIRKVNYRLRDAIFSRQRYWGEPIPIYYKDTIATPMPFDKLPLELPEIDKFLPTETGDPPLGRAKNWEFNGYPVEKNTMPGFAGSSAYYLRYMDPYNKEALVSKEADEYWRDVDLYVGGTEHATGHLIYSRFWNKFLFDRGYVCEDEPFKKLINQGMIQGRSNFVYRIVMYKPDSDSPNSTTPITTEYFISLKYVKLLEEGSIDWLPEAVLQDLLDRAGVDKTSLQIRAQELRVDVNIVHNDHLDLDKFRQWRPEFANAEFILDEANYICGWAVEKMSKSYFNVVNPDMICEQYGADTLRIYEMFLGPLEQSKPWDMNGIDGVFRFLRKYWRLFFDKDTFSVSEEAAVPQELKVLHRLIKKVQDDMEGFSFNTSVSAFMISVNELGELKCNKRSILEPLTVLLSSYAPHITEEVWEKLGHTTSIALASFPEYNESYTIENSFEYPVSFNGKLRFKKELALNLSVQEIEKTVLADEQAQKYLSGNAPKKVIVVPGKIINIVI
jgi:leucyl-tRNA synthetase